MIKITIIDKDTFDTIDTISLNTEEDFKVSNKSVKSTRRSEGGFVATDNVFRNPQSISIIGKVSDIDISISGAYSQIKPKAVRDKLDRIYLNNDKYLCNIYNTKTGKNYNKYIVSSLNTDEDKTSTSGFKYDIRLDEITYSEVGVSTLDYDKGAPPSNGVPSDGDTDGYDSDSDTDGVGSDLLTDALVEILKKLERLPRWSTNY